MVSRLTSLLVVVVVGLSDDSALESFLVFLGVDPGEPAGKSMVVLESPSSCLVSSEKVTDFLRCMDWFSEPAEVSGACAEPLVVLIFFELRSCAVLSELEGGPFCSGEATVLFETIRLRLTGRSDTRSSWSCTFVVMAVEVLSGLSFAYLSFRPSLFHAGTCVDMTNGRQKATMWEEELIHKWLIREKNWTSFSLTVIKS